MDVLEREAAKLLLQVSGGEPSPRAYHAACRAAEPAPRRAHCPAAPASQLGSQTPMLLPPSTRSRVCWAAHSLSPLPKPDRPALQIERLTARISPGSEGLPQAVRRYMPSPAVHKKTSYDALKEAGHVAAGGSLGMEQGVSWGVCGLHIGLTGGRRCQAVRRGASSCAKQQAGR